MILLLPGNAKALLTHITPTRERYGWLLSPRRTMTKTGLYGLCFGVDNECYTLGERFDGDRYRRALVKIAEIHGRQDCLFATAPDIVSDAVATWERSEPWLREIRRIGLPCALVAQDGIESLRIQWPAFDAIFIGGSTEWKLSDAAAWITREARRKGKWVHMGRVNSVYRAARIIEPPDSVDGTAWAKHPGEYARQWQHWLSNGKPRQPRLSAST